MKHISGGTVNNRNNSNIIIGIWVVCCEYIAVNTVIYCIIMSPIYCLIYSGYMGWVCQPNYHTS